MSPRVEPADGFLTDYYEHVSEDDVRYYTPPKRCWNVPATTELWPNGANRGGKP